VKRKLVTLGVLLAVLAGGSLLVALVGAGGESGDAQAIVVEQFTTPDGVVEVLVTVSQELNVPATAGGAKNVVFECVDGKDEVVLNSQQSWPLLSDGDPPAPHVHQPATPEELQQLSKCRFPDTKPVLEGRVGLAR